MFARTPPPGHAIRTDRSTRLVDEGRLVIGGSLHAHVPCPPHKQERSSAGSATHPSTGAAGRGLAADLIAAGMAHPHTPTPYPTVPPSFTTVEVDGAVSRAAALTAADTDVLALLSPGAHPEPGLLESALAHFADPSVAAVVPRVLPDRTRPLGYVQAAVAAVAADLLGLDRGADGPVLPGDTCRPGTCGPDRRVHHHRSTLLGPGPAGTPPRTGPRPPPRGGERGCEVHPGGRSSCSRGGHNAKHRAGRRPLPGPSRRDHRPHPLSDSFDPTVHYDPKLQESADIDLLVPGRSRVAVGHEPRSQCALRCPSTRRYLRPHRAVKRRTRGVRSFLGEPGRRPVPTGCPHVQLFEECNNRGPSTDPPSPRSLESLR